MRRFRVYRPEPPAAYLAAGAANPPDQPQFEGVEFSDGTVCVRWLTEYRSHSIWANFVDLHNIHGHPEYGTRIEWLDGEPESVPRPERESGPHGGDGQEDGFDSRAAAGTGPGHPDQASEKTCSGSATGSDVTPGHDAAEAAVPSGKRLRWA